jgi:excisionase family DNA binding protein
MDAKIAEARELIEKAVALLASVEVAPSAPPKPVDRLLKIPEVAQRLGVSVRKVYYLVSDERLPTVDVGGTKVRESDLERWLRQRR